MQAKDRLKTLFLVSFIGGFLTFLILILAGKFDPILMFVAWPFLFFGGLLTTGVIVYLKTKASIIYKLLYFILSLMLSWGIFYASGFILQFLGL